MDRGSSVFCFEGCFRVCTASLARVAMVVRCWRAMLCFILTFVNSVSCTLSRPPAVSPSISSPCVRPLQAFRYVSLLLSPTKHAFLEKDASAHLGANSTVLAMSIAALTASLGRQLDFRQSAQPERLRGYIGVLDFSACACCWVTISRSFPRLCTTAVS